MQTSTKKRTSFRLNNELLLRLKDGAKRENSSLNSYVENILTGYVYDIPNAVTINAIEDARAGTDQKTVDMTDLDAFVKSCIDE